MATGPWEQYQERVRRQNEINRQSAMQGAGAGAAAAEKARRQRELFNQMMAQKQAEEAQGGRTAFTPNFNAQSATIDEIPGQFSNVIQSVQPPAPMGEGFQRSRTGAVPGIDAPETIGNIDWDTTPWFIDKQTGAMRVLPANNNKEGFMGFGGGVGRETGMTDEEFELAWAQQYAMGKEMPSGWKTATGRGTDAPSEAQALKILLDRGSDTGVLESEAQKRSRREKAAGKVTSNVREFAPKLNTRGINDAERGRPPIQAALSGVRDMFGFLGGPEGDVRNQRIIGDTVAQDIVPSMEMDDPTRSGPITPMMALTPEQQFEQQVEAEAAGLSLKEQQDIQMQGVSRGDAQREQRAGGGTGLTAAESLAIQTRGLHDSERDRPPMVNVDASSEMGGEDATAANVPWTPEQWRAAGYTQMPDGSWDIVSPSSPAAAVEVPKVETTITPPSAADLSAAQANADAAFERNYMDVKDTAILGSQPRQATADTFQATIPSATPAVSDMFANVAQTGAPLWQAAQDPFQQYQRYRMAQAGGAPVGTLASEAGQRALSAGYQPAYGRFLLGGTQLGETGLPTGQYAGPAGEGQAFGQYLAGGQRRDLADIRSLYGGLGSYLGQLGTDTPLSELGAGYQTVFGMEPERKDILSATQAALGMGSGMGARSYRNLGTMYDLMQQQYGPQGAGKFADWVGTAFQPQQQQPLFQQPANGPQPQLLGTETVQEDYWQPWQKQGAM